MWCEHEVGRRDTIVGQRDIVRMNVVNRTRESGETRFVMAEAAFETIGDAGGVFALILCQLDALSDGIVAEGGRSVQGSHRNVDLIEEDEKIV